MGNNHLTHFDLVVTDTGETVDFYAEVFDWNFGTETPEGYRSVYTGAEPGGGIMMKEGADGSLIPCFRVSSIQAILDKIPVPNLGGAVIQDPGPHPMDSNVLYAIIEDHHGVRIGLLQYPEEELKA